MEAPRIFEIRGQDLFYIDSQFFPIDVKLYAGTITPNRIEIEHNFYSSGGVVTAIIESSGDTLTWAVDNSGHWNGGKSSFNLQRIDYVDSNLPIESFFQGNEWTGILRGTADPARDLTEKRRASALPFRADRRSF